MSSISTTVPKQQIAPTEKIPYCPNQEELVALFSGYAPSYIKSQYKQIKKDFPLSKGITQPKCLTQYQFAKFIIRFGLPQGFKQSDFPLLDGVQLY